MTILLDAVADALNAERGLLGGLLWQPTAALAPLLSGEFSQERHRDLWRVYEDLASEGVPRDITMVCERINSAIWSRAEALAYLAQLIEDTIAAVWLEEYAKAVRKHATDRAVHVLGQELQRTGLSPEEIQDRIRAMPGPVSPSLVTPIDGWRAVQERWGQSHIQTGLRALDEIVDGLAPGKLVAVGGRTSHGKTAFMLDRAIAMAKRNVAVEILSLEETHASLTARLLAIETGYMNRAILHGAVTGEQVNRLDVAADRLDRLPLRVTTAESIKSLDAHALLAIVRRSPAPVIMIDYLQKITTQDHSRAYGIERVLNELHQAAIQQNAVIWINVQLNREIEGRRGDPQLSDLRDSGASEIIPRQVWLLYWPFKHWNGQGETPDPAQYLVRVAKNSDGGTGDAYVRYDARTGRFYDERSGAAEEPSWIHE